MNKKELKNIGYFLKLVLLFCLSSYICLLIFPLIKLKYTNPNNFIGFLSQRQFSPLNNSLRYIFYIFAMPALFIWFKKMLDAKKYLWLRYIFIGTFIFSFFLSTATIYLQKYSSIDMFHDSEQLGVGSAVYFFNKVPFKDMFFLHGAFSDPLIASLSFKLFGPAIGSFYLLYSLLNLTTFVLLIFLAFILIKDEFIFYASIIFFYGSLFLLTLWRDLISFIYLIVAVLVVKKIIKDFIGFFILSFLAFSALYYSADKGYYLVILNIFFWIIYSLLKTNKFHQFKKVGQIVKELQKNIRNFIAIILGTITANLFGILIFGNTGLIAFYKETFLHLPMMKSFLDEYIYPPFSLSKLFPNWWPIIFVCLFIIFVLYYFSYRKKEIDSSFILPLFFTITSIIFFRNALGRSDTWHILYVVQYLFLAGFIILDFLLIKKTTFKKYSIYLVILIIFLTPFFNIERVTNIPSVALSDIKIFFSMSRLEDNYWLNYEERLVRDYILANTTKSDKIFIFSNEAVYYYLTQRDNPTRYYTIWFAIGDKYQKEVVTDLEKDRPKYVLYCDNLCNRIDELSNVEKLPLINDWILKNYQLDKRIGSAEIYRQKTVIIK